MTDQQQPQDDKTNDQHQDRPTDRAHVNLKPEAEQQTEKFVREDKVSLDLGKPGESIAYPMIVAKSRQDPTTKRMEYQLKSPEGFKYHDNEWVDQKYVSAR